MTTPTSPTTASADALDPAVERDGTIPAGRADPRDWPSQEGSATPLAAVIKYATIDINWHAATLAGVQRKLAGLSIGPARQAALQQAASAPTDRSLIAEDVSNHGQVVSAQPGRGPAMRRWVIVTREQTTGQGPYHALPFQLHVTYAVATHTHRGWVISQWSPQT